MKNEYKNSSGGDKNIEIRLWEYIDGLCDEREQSLIEKLIVENREWREKYSVLLELHQLIDLTELEEPSMRFTKNIMDEIARTQIAPAAKKYINNKIIWGIAAFFIVMIVGALLYGMAQIDWSAGSSNRTEIDFSEIDYSKLFNNTYLNIFMMLNVVFGLMLLDKLLSNKRKKLMENV